MRDWSHDGRWLCFEGRPRPGSRHQQVWALDLQTDSARVILQEDFDLAAPCLSPDGRWLAYLSSESGRDELFVRSFPDLQRKWQVSNGGASAPHWRADGRELLFANATTRGTAYSAVPVSVTGADLVFGSAQLLFTLQPDQVASTPNADHTRFLTVIERQAGPSAPIRVILGWHMGGR